MMNRSMISGLFLVVASVVSSAAFAAVQRIVATPSSFDNVSPGDTVQFTVSYPASNPADATGLGLKIYFDSSKLTLNGTSNVYAVNKLAESTGNDAGNGDGDSSTDKLINIAWVNFSGPWPAPGNDLVTVTFTASAGFTSDTQVNFTGDPSAGNTFSSSPVPVKLKVITPPPTDDKVAPKVTAPADITKEATGPTTPVSLGVATVTDNVDTGLSATPNPAGPFAVGVHTVTWTATDTAGNIGTDTQKVTITDTTPPTVIAPPDKKVTATGPNTVVNLGVATANDLVDGVITPTPSTTGPFPVGVTNVIWSATDAHGNKGTATQTVTVTEASVAPPKPILTITPPTETNSDTVVVEVKGEKGLKILVNGTQVGIIGENGKTRISLDTSGPSGVKKFSITLKDDVGRESSPLIISITKTTCETCEDKTPPVITVPPDVTVRLKANETEATVDFGTASAVDNVDGPVPVTWSRGADVATFGVGTHTIIWRAVDSSGNVATATQRITVLAAPAAPATIPTLSEWGIILLSVLLALAAWLGIGRKEQV